MFGWLRRPFEGVRRRRDPEDDADGTLGRIVVTILWLPIQLSIMMLFAAGGILFLLLIGLALVPFAGLFLLVRRLLSTR